MKVSHVVIRHVDTTQIRQAIRAWVHIFIRCIRYHTNYCCYLQSPYKLSGTAPLSARKIFLSRWRRSEEHFITHTHAMGLSINYTITRSLLSDSSPYYLAMHVRAYDPHTSGWISMSSMKSLQLWKVCPRPRAVGRPGHWFLHQSLTVKIDK